MDKMRNNEIPSIVVNNRYVSNNLLSLRNNVPISNLDSNQFQHSSHKHNSNVDSFKQAMPSNQSQTYYENPSYIEDDLIEKEKSFKSTFSTNRGTLETTLKTWDIFQTLPPRNRDEINNTKCFDTFIKFLKIFIYFLTFVTILGSAVVSKLIILLMTSMIRVNRVITVCNHSNDTNDVKQVKSYVFNDAERILWLWCLFFAAICPEVLSFGRCLRICCTKVFTVETLHSIGISLLIFLIMPTINSINGAMITNAMCFIPVVITLFNDNNLGFISRVLNFSSAIVQLIAVIVWPLIMHFGGSDKALYLPIALLFISLQWWENFVDEGSQNAFTKRLLTVKKDLSDCRYFVYTIMSVWKIIVVFASMIVIESLLYGPYVAQDLFDNLFNHLTNQYANSTNPNNQVIANEDTIYISNIYVMLVVQIVASYVCYICSKFSCKIQIQLSFAVSINLTVPTIILFFIYFYDACDLSVFVPSLKYFNWYLENNRDEYIFYNIIGLWVATIFSQIWSTIYVFTQKSIKLSTTDKLFVNPMYNSVIIDQSLALNRRRGDEMSLDNDEDEDEDDYYNTDTIPSSRCSEYYKSSTLKSSTLNSNIIRFDKKIKVLACVTVWHETREEMKEMIKSIMRLDRDQCARREAQRFFKIHPNLTNYYELECNIFVDDAFEQGETDRKDDRVINRFVRQLIEVMNEAATNVHEIPIKLLYPNLIVTPYGGRLEWTMPGQNKLIFHLKDRLLIRNKKRWSQCMYMYYLLGYRIAGQKISETRKETMVNNTFILALDGDIIFYPNALHLVLNLMKKNRKLGAACGRVHPIGSGPMVWYQKFEYAVSHWLQKASEHIFGCVLCSPGCFSLFRAKALMEVMKEYTTKSSEARHFVQYDQGEDRWLCTLILKRGWRIEYCAPSDSYTHAPEGCGEYINQQRRWKTSTLANILDILDDHKRVIEANNNISKSYIFYQAILAIGTIISPGTIFLMIVGAMSTVMQLSVTIAFITNIIMIFIFSTTCLISKNTNLKMLLIEILSTAYALLMLTVLIGEFIEMIKQGLLNPNSIFFISIIGVIVLGALLHPQEFQCVIPIILYLLCIPAMYLIIPIYSIFNLNNVSWGTREIIVEENKNETEKSSATQSGNVFGLLSTICCLRKNKIEDKLSKIDDSLVKVTEIIDTLKSYQRYNIGSSLERKESMKIVMNKSISDFKPQPPLNENAVTDNNEVIEILEPMSSIPVWVRDNIFRKFCYDELTDSETQFWKDCIEEYLLPTDKEEKNKLIIKAKLKDLRNRAVFAFAMMNTIYVFFIFLLQLNKDYFVIHIHLNRKDHDHMGQDWDPISLLMVVFFGSIIFIQSIGMLIHRFVTLELLLASTPIDFFSKQPENVAIDENAVNVVKQLLQLKGVRQFDETDVKTEAQPHRRKTSLHPQPPQQLNLVHAFRKRVMDLNNDSIDVTKLSGSRRESIIQDIKMRQSIILRKMSELSDKRDPKNEAENSQSMENSFYEQDDTFYRDLPISRSLRRKHGSKKLSHC